MGDGLNDIFGNFQCEGRGARAYPTRGGNPSNNAPQPRLKCVRRPRIVANGSDLASGVSRYSIPASLALSRGGLGGDGAAQAEGVGVLAHRGDAEGDVLFQRDAEFVGAFADVVAADAFGEGFVLEAAFDGIHFQVEDALRGTNVGAGGEKAGKLVAGEQGVLERRMAWDVAIVGVGEDGADDFLGIAAFAEDFGAFGGGLFVWGMGFVVPARIV